MKEKKELILNKCRDLIYKEVFNNDYDDVKRIYTDNVIQTRLDNYLEELIERGEIFYGKDFVEDFVNERTDNARRWLIKDLYSNSIDDKIVKNDYSYLKPKETYDDVINELVNNCHLTLDKANEFIKNYVIDDKIVKNDYSYLKPKETYDDVINELVSNCHLTLDKANEFIKKYVKDDEIRRGALDYFEKQEVEKETSKDEFDEINQEELPHAEKDFSGLDKLSSDLEENDEPIPVKTEEPKPGLIQKFKEKWKNPKFRKKVIIGAAVTAIGLVAIALNPEVQAFISQLFSSFGPDQIDADALNNVSEQVASVKTAAVAAQVVDPSVLDTSSWNLEGLNIADNAYDSVNGNTNLTASEWFSNRLQGLYDTSTGQMLDISNADLHDTDYVKELLQNDNVSAVFGNGEIGTLDNADGFVNGDDFQKLIDNNGNVQELVNNGRSR